MDNHPNIYKFRSMNINSLSSLATNKIWFASKDDLNDPFEGLINVIEPSSDEERITKFIEFGAEAVEKKSNLSTEDAKNVVLKRYIDSPEEFLEFVEERRSSFIDELDYHQKKLGIFSTSSDIPNDERTQVSNMLLWSHYADEFKGFCIQYDLELLRDSLETMNAESFAWTKVNYIDKPHSIDIFEKINESAISYLKSIQCKHEQWLYECEIRLISTTTGLKSFSPSAVKSIYIGERMPKEERDLLVGVVKHNLPETDMYSVSIGKGQFALSINKI